MWLYFSSSCTFSKDFLKKAIMLGEFLDVGMDVSRLVGLYSYGTFGRPGLSLSGQVCVMVAHMMAYLSG